MKHALVWGILHFLGADDKEIKWLWVGLEHCCKSNSYLWLISSPIWLIASTDASFPSWVFQLTVTSCLDFWGLACFCCAIYVCACVRVWCVCVCTWGKANAKAKGKVGICECKTLLLNSLILILEFWEMCLFTFLQS